MKKYISFIIVLLFTVSTFAQSKTKEENITQLMYAKNGMGTIEKAKAKFTPRVSESNKAIFITKMNNLKTEFIQNTMAEFKNDYTNDQIIAIYTEFHSDIINRSDLHNNFFSKFRRLKGAFSRSVKELLFQYQ